MPRWKALPEGLDPQIREFAGQLRRVVDRSGLSISAVADCTGYSKSSWERYLNGRLLPPQGAIEALAGATQTDVRHLATMWELAARAWGRAELRHDTTVEAVRIDRARAALRDIGGPGAHPPSDRASNDAGTAAGHDPADPADLADPASDGGDRSAADTGSDPASDTGSDTASDTEAGPDTPGTRRSAPVPTPPPQAGNALAVSAEDGRESPSRPGAGPIPESGESPEGPAGDTARRREEETPGLTPGRRASLFLVGVAGALALSAVAFLVTGAGGANDSPAAGPTRSPSPSRELPAGVRCTGEGCIGKDPESMGCGGQYAETVSDALLGGAYFEVRYSAVCSAAWARVTDAASGDTLRVRVGKRSESSRVGAAGDGYTPMVPLQRGRRAEACLVPGSGPAGCTKPATGPTAAPTGSPAARVAAPGPPASDSLTAGLLM